MAGIQESNTPSNPLLAFLVQPYVGEGDVPCRRSLWQTIKSWTRAEWQTMLWTSAPFPEAWPDCRCHRCVDSQFLYHVGRLIRLPQSYGYGYISGIDHFEDDLVCFKISGEEVKTREQSCYLVAPRNFSTLDPVDEFRFRVQCLFWPLRVLIWGKPRPLDFTFLARNHADWIFP